MEWLGRIFIMILLILHVGIIIEACIGVLGSQGTSRDTEYDQFYFRNMVGCAQYFRLLSGICDI